MHQINATVFLLIIFSTDFRHFSRSLDIIRALLYAELVQQGELHVLSLCTRVQVCIYDQFLPLVTSIFYSAN